MADSKARPIIVVKRKVQAAGHHGGAWKVAYADFVTAMMAFFMVMWLVTAVSKEQRAALFEYFKNPSMEQGKSFKAAPGQAGPGGASTSPIDLGGGLDAPRSSTAKDAGLGQPVAPTSVDEARNLADAEERSQLESLKKELEEAIATIDALRAFKDQLLVDITPEGLRIQIVDKLNRPMFDLGSSKLKDYTTAILRELGVYLNTVPNRISLSGHTDDKPYAGGRGYTNWELSADRANAARRALLDGSLEQRKIARVVGLASSVLFDRKDPLNSINRRISIIVMTKRAEEAALTTDAPLVDLGAPAPATDPAPGSPAVPVAAEAPVAPVAAAEAPPAGPAAAAGAAPAQSPRESVASAATAASKALAEFSAKQQSAAR